MKSVYLGGTISPSPEHLEWRERVKRWANFPSLFRPGVIIYSRCEIIDPLEHQNPKHFTTDGLHDSTTPDSLFVRADIADIQRADIVMCVYWNAPVDMREHPFGVVAPSASYRRQSIGTWAEFGIAAYLHKPIIVVSDDNAVLDHPFVKVFAAAKVATIDAAIMALEKLI